MNFTNYIFNSNILSSLTTTTIHVSKQKKQNVHIYKQIHMFIFSCRRTIFIYYYALSM